MYLILAEGDADFSIQSPISRRRKRIPGPMNNQLQFEFSEPGQLCFTVNIINDNLLEFEESFDIDFDSGSVSPQGVQVMPITSTSIVINDDEGELCHSGQTKVELLLHGFC